MKFSKHEQEHIQIPQPKDFCRARREEKPRPVNPDSIKQRCIRDGVKKHPATIISHMKRHNMTYEEAIAYVPKTQRKAGQIGKKSSHWNKTTPGSPMENAIREGKAKRKEEE